MQNEVDIKSWELCKIEMGIIYVVVRHTEDSHGIYIHCFMCRWEILWWEKGNAVLKTQLHVDLLSNLLNLCEQMSFKLLYLYSSYVQAI